MDGLCSLLFLLVLLKAGCGEREPECEWRNEERVCAVYSPPQRILLLSDRLIVGAINSLYSFSPDLHLLDVGDVSPSTVRTEQCRAEAHQTSLCRNYVKVVQQLNASSLLVCGTNAVFPKCRFVSQYNLSQWQYMTEEGRKDVGFSPHSNDPNVAVLSDSGSFFTATFFNFRQTQQTIGLSHSLEDKGRELNVQTPSFTPSWLNKPVFLSAYDVNQHAYFIAREPAYDYEDDGGEVEFARIIRVCKNDSGFRLFPGDSTLTFKTFQKARIRCRKTGPGSLPYDYNRLQATFLFRPNNSREPILYGAFSSAVNGPQGAALCRFSFSDIETLFDNGEYWVGGSGSWNKHISGSFSCPGSSGVQRTDEQALEQQLLTGVVDASQPRLTVLGDEMLLLVVDYVEYEGNELEVVVTILKSGVVLQIVWYRGSIYKHIIQERESQVTNMILHINQQTEERVLLLTTSNTIESLTLGQCNRYTTCLSCLDSHDPYCGWNNVEIECTNILLSSSNLSHYLTISDEAQIKVCASHPPTPIPPSSGSNHSLSSPETPPATTVVSPSSTQSTNTNEGAITPAGLGSEERGESTGLLAGATVGSFLFGIPVGLVVCYLVFIVFIKKGSKSEDGDQNIRSIQNQNQCDRNDKPLTNRMQLNHRNHTTTATKNVNNQEDHSREEGDVLTALPFSKRPLYSQQPSIPRSFSFPHEETYEKDGCLYSPV